MKRLLIVVAVALLAVAVYAAPPLFSSASRSEWTVSDGKATIATATLTTDGTKSRVDWKPTSGATVTYIARDGKIYVKNSGGDLDLGAHKGSEKSIVPALLLPTQTAKKDKVTATGAVISAYTFGSSTAAFTNDAKGPQVITVTSGATKYTLKRASLNAGGVTSAMFEITPKPSKLAGLKNIASNAAGLGGESDTSVAASAGASGAREGVRLADGGDYDAVDALEETDEATQKAREAQAKKFQSEGKVGKSGGH